MSVSTVYAALNGAIVNGSIDLWAASFEPALADVNGILRLFGIDSSYFLTNALLSQGQASVTLTGNGMFGQPGDPGGMRYPVLGTLLYVEDQSGNGTFRLTLAITDTGWSFSTFFNGSALPPCQQANVAEEAVLWTPSFFIDLRLDSPSFSADSKPAATLQLAGFLPEAPVFGPYLDFIKPWPLSLQGEVTMPGQWDQAPVLTLTAMAANSSSLAIGQETGLPDGPSGLVLQDLGFQLVLRTDLSEETWGRTAFSVLNLIGTVQLGEPPYGLSATLTTQVLTSGRLWHLTAVFDPLNASIVRGMAQLTTIFGLPALPLPDNFPLLYTFKFQTVELYFTSPIAQEGQPPPVPTLQFLAVTIGSDDVWTPPVPFVKIHHVGTRWLWGWTQVNVDANSNEMKTISSISGSVYGTFNFGGDSGDGTGGRGQPSKPPSGDGNHGGMAILPEPGTALTSTKGVDIEVGVDLPELFISGNMKAGDIIPIGDAFTYFFGDPGPTVTTEKVANVTALSFSADPLAQTYAANADIIFTTGQGGLAAPGWEIDLVVITVTLERLSFWINVNAGKVGGGISGVLTLDDGLPRSDSTPRLLLQAEYPIQDPETPEGWVFSGFLYPGTVINLTNLVAEFLGLDTPPASVPVLTVNRLIFSFSTGTQAYLLGGTIAGRWYLELFGTPLKINAAASIDIVRRGNNPNNPATGTLSGFFAINKIAVSAAMDVGVDEKTYLFKVQFDKLWLQATTSWRGEANNRHQAISLQLGGVTLGDILEYLVNLAAPTLGYTLDSPWDILQRVELSSFVLTLDPHDNVVEFVFKANVDITIATLTSIGVRYTKGGNGKVDLILEGSFLGKDYKGADALAWDVIKDPPPAIPGQGTELVDLRYLGIGQRIRIQNPPDTVSENIAYLQQFMLPVNDPTQLPSTTGAVAFSADSQWLIGLDIGIMAGTIDLGFLFNDPILYGLSVALGGEKAGSLAGLRFEILYKKISNDIGMFRVELRIPDAFRTFQLGIASITLGIAVIEVYTNGNFKVDLGFPYNRNFDRSFSVQAYIFIGRGGFYLGVLNGATSSRVPKITNGNFSPVLELGIGIAAGVGREIKAGIFSGGAYVQIEVIFQGVLGWFNPNSNGTAPAMYFWAQGIVAIHGKVYGYVDFKVIKISLTLEAYAQVSAIFECYRPTVFALEVSVRAEAEVKIIFFTISFSFQVQLNIGFTLGTVQQTPWILASGQNAGTNAGTLAHGRRRDPSRSLSALVNGHLKAVPLLKSPAMGATPEYQDHWGWNPEQKLFPDGQAQTAHFTLLPAFTVADVPISWTDTEAPANLAPRYRAAFVLCADTGVAADAKTPAATRSRSAALSALSATDADTDALSADLLVQVLLLYSLYSIPGGPSNENDPITAGQLLLLALQLESNQAADDGFALEMLEQLFATNLHLAISGDPGGTPLDRGGFVAPIPPYLSWVSPQGGDVNFATFSKVGPWYEWGIAQLMGQYFPEGGQAGEPPKADDPALYESFSAYLFRDFCLMIAKAAVQEAQGLMQTATVTVNMGPDGDLPSLADLANGFVSVTVPYAVRSGDTVASVAEALGATVAEIEFLNPDLQAELATAAVGSAIPVALGISPEVLAMDNPQQAFALSTLPLGTVPHQVAANETLADIASLFHILSLASFFETTDHIPTGLGGSPNLLLKDAYFDYPQQQWQADIGQLLAAAIFFTRYTLPKLDQSAWYAQVIADLNPIKLEKLYPLGSVPVDLELPPGQTLTIPAAFNDQANTGTYLTVPGDTLNRIAAALALVQVYPQTSPESAPDWQAFLAQVTVTGGNVCSIPAWADLIVQSGETMESLSRRLIVNVSWTGTDPDDPRNGIWTYNWDAIVLWCGQQPILSPLAVVPAPNATAQAETGVPLSFENLSQTYGVAIANAAERLKDIAGLYAEGTLLQVTSVPVQTVKALVDGVLSGEGLARIVHQSSRSLMAGLQLPALAVDKDGHTVPSKTQTLPLYDISGQQFDVPVSTDPEKGDEVALTLSVSSQADWITLMDSVTVAEEDSRMSLLARHPDALAHNIGLAAGRTLSQGMIVLTATASTLEYQYTNAEIIDNGPATSYTVALAMGPKALPLSGTVPRTYGLDHRIEIQTPIQLPIPGAITPPVSGQPSLWPFPEDLLLRAIAGVATPYEVLTTNQGGAAGRHAHAVASVTWASLIPFTIRQIDAGLKLFDLMGVDGQDRYRLLALMRWLPNDTSGKTQAFALLNPAPNATNTAGLTVQTGVPEDIYLIKTNLSTESQPPSGALRLNNDAPPLYYASLAGLGDFLTLLWEGSTVGGIGYYLGVGNDLPANIFDDKGKAVIQLLVIAGTQQDSVAAGRALLPFNSCALAGPGLDGAIQSLFVESYDDSDKVTQALVPPGNAGFVMKTHYPADTVGGQEQEVKLRKLYSLVSYSILGSDTSPFAAAPSGMPAPPAPDDLLTVPRWQKERLLRKGLLMDEKASLTPKPYWRYDQVLPMYNFAPASALPNVDGLPAAPADPYRGFGDATALPQADFQLGFGDVLGNRSAPPPSGEGGVLVDVGYTDDLIGIMAWPALVCHYEVMPADGNATLAVTIALRPSAVMPSPSQTGASAAETAKSQAQTYAKSYYQLGQTIKGSLVTTLKNTDGDGLDIDVAPLWRFAAGGYAFSMAAARLQDALAPAGSNLAGLCATYHVRYAEMALANADRFMHNLFGAQAMAVPAFVTFAEHDTATSIAQAPRPQGWPEPTPEALLLAPENGGLPLRIGAVLKIAPAVQFSTGDNPECLASIALLHNTTPTLLATDNAAIAILREGFVFYVETTDNYFAAVTVTPQTHTLNDVASSFAQQGVNVTPANLAQLHADEPGMLAANVTLSSTVWVALAKASLDDNSSGLTQAQLAPLNVNMPDLFDAGTMVYLGNFAAETGVHADATQTLRQFADSYACPIELLLAANADAPLPDGNHFTIPGLIAWPLACASIRIPYTLRQTDTLNALALRFLPVEGDGDAATLLATANADMPQTLAGQLAIDVTVGTQIVSIVTPANGESFGSALAQVQLSAPTATMGDLVAAIGDEQGALQARRLMLCPPCRLPQDCTPENIPGLYTLPTNLFALANTGMPDLIVAGLEIFAPDHKTSVTTQTGDTFNTLIVRFAEQQVQTDAASIVAANPNKPFLKAGALALLPPAPIRPQADIGTQGPYPGAVFPLSVAVRLQRPEALIHPDFKLDGLSPVGRVESNIPAPAREQGTGGEGSLTFNDFVATMREALPSLCLATGKSDTSSQDIWAVNFGLGGIENVTVRGSTTVPGNPNPQPRFFALKPLYNSLISRAEVDIRPLTDQGELSPKVTYTDFQGIDAEVWAANFIADVDRFLDAHFAAILYSAANLRPFLQTVLDAKATLATEIANGLGVILAIDDPLAQEGLISAQKELTQQLGISLSSAYNTSAVIQFDGAISSPWQQNQQLPPAALYGQLNPSDAPDDEALAKAWTISAAKTWLNQASPFVTFMMTVADPVSHRSVDTALEYDYSYIEHNILEQFVPNGYVSSDWLSFIPPLAGTDRPNAVHTDMGNVTTPIPLRNFPALPVIFGQTAQTAYVPSAESRHQRRKGVRLNSSVDIPIGEMPLWNYSFTYTHQHAEQDDVIVTADFNLHQQAVAASAVEDPQDLFTELAKYIAVADKLWPILDGLGNPSNPISDSEQNAVATFATLTTNIANYWPIRLSAHSYAANNRNIAATASFAFRARVTDRDSITLGREIGFLTLIRLGASPGPDGQWPVVFCRKPDGSLQMLEAQPVSGGMAVDYKVPTDVSIPNDWPAFTLEWQNLNVSEWQNATGQVFVERNQRLLGNDGPSTNASFVFKTDEVKASGVVTPINVWSERVQLVGTPGPNYVETALNNAFNQLFPEVMQGTLTATITVGISYAYELVTDAEDPARSLVSEMPVLLYPDKPLDSNTAGILQNAVDDWANSYQPNTNGGEWIFSLTLYSSMETQKRPLFISERLFCKL